MGGLGGRGAQEAEFIEDAAHLPAAHNSSGGSRPPQSSDPHAGKTGLLGIRPANSLAPPGRPQSPLRYSTFTSSRPPGATPSEHPTARPRRRATPIVAPAIPLRPGPPWPAGQSGPGSASTPGSVHLFRGPGEFSGANLLNLNPQKEAPGMAKRKSPSPPPTTQKRANCPGPPRRRRRHRRKIPRWSPARSRARPGNSSGTTSCAEDADLPLDALAPLRSDIPRQSPATRSRRPRPRPTRRPPRGEPAYDPTLFDGDGPGRLSPAQGETRRHRRTSSPLFACGQSANPRGPRALSIALECTVFPDPQPPNGPRLHAPPARDPRLSTALTPETHAAPGSKRIASRKGRLLAPNRTDPDALFGFAAFTSTIQGAAHKYPEPRA